MRVGKVLMGLAGGIFALVAFGLLIGGGILFWGYETQRDADGFFNSPAAWLSSEGHAVVSSAAELASYPGDWWPDDLDMTLRLRATSARDGEVFIGIAASSDLDGYLLKSVAHDQVQDLSADLRDLRDLRMIPYPGGSPATPPGEQTFWAAYVQGEGEQVLDWSPERGIWTAVIMNGDGSSPVTVSVVAGGRVPILRSVSLGMMGGGTLLAALAALLLLGATRSADRAPWESAGPAGAGIYPAALQGSLDPHLSPALWLIKWFLAIPHYLVLAFLWAGFVLLTFFAWIAILFTGRYPRSIFEFNVGVMRWSWRVSYYAYSALGTDRYPPFTLQDVDYPARFSVEYPEQLSRGLALVKWWLLALPHYLIVGVLSSGLLFWTSETAEWVGHNPVFEIGGGLIALLVLIAGLALLFTGRYPRDLFDFVMGLNRWVFRVWAYAGLMTDEYPPFRLDMGGREPRGKESEGSPGTSE